MPDQPIIFWAHTVRANPDGASRDFEEMLGQLVATTWDGPPDERGRLILAKPGDWGIDVFVGKLDDRVTVWQAKYFVQGIGRSQQQQIRDSFASVVRAAEQHGFTVERWVLCVPASMDAPTTQWWDGWKAKQERATGIDIELWDETVLRARLLRDAAASIRQHYYSSHASPLPPLGPASSPYRGLRAFTEKDAQWFFGRESAADELLARLAASLDGTGLVVVSGVSGAGKSSLLRAGVLPRIADRGLPGVPEARAWRSVVITPGPRPLDTLAAGVAGLAGVHAPEIRDRLTRDAASFAMTMHQAKSTFPAPGRVILVVDQCEQLFSLCESERERDAFLTALLAAAHGPDAPALVVLVVRADFEARLADHAPLASAVQERFLLTSMSEPALRDAITGPAERAGAPVHEQLVKTLLDDVGRSMKRPAGAGVLPLLSHALDQAWQARAARQGLAVTLADYEKTGGIEKALATSAQKVYESLTGTQKDIARQVFTRLTAIGVDGADTAARMARTDLVLDRDGQDTSTARARDVEKVLERFAAERLLTLDASTVAISHEALLAEWPLLRDEWLAEARADRVTRSRMHSAATEWSVQPRRQASSYLYGGSLLDAATAVARRIEADPRHTPLSPAEERFLRASSAAASRSKWARRIVTGLLAVMVVALTAATIATVSELHTVTRQRDVATANQVASESETTGDADPATSALESVAAWQISPTAPAKYAMLAAAAHPGSAVLPIPGGADSSVESVAFSPDRRMIAAGSSVPGPGDAESGVLQMWDAVTRKPLMTIRVASTTVVSVAFSADGKTLAARTDDGTVRFWSTVTRRETGTIRTQSDQLDRFSSSYESSLAFSRDRRFLVTGTETGVVQLWNATTRQPLGEPLTGSGDPASSAAFSPDGKILAAASGGRVRLWDVATRQPLPSLDAGGIFQFSPDGTLATLDGNTVRLWDVATRRTTGEFNIGSGSDVFSMAFGAGGKVLATGDINGAITLWDVATGQRLAGSLTSPDGINSMAFSSDGSTLASGGNGFVRLWDTATDPVGVPIAVTPGAVGVALSPDGGTLGIANFGQQGTMQLWSTTANRETTVRSGHRDEIGSVAFSPGGKTMAIGGNDGTLQLWELATLRLVADLTAQASGAISYSVAFSPDGKILAAGGDGTVSVWNVAARRRIATLSAGSSSNTIDSLAFSPDGRLLAAAGSDGAVRVWSTSSHRQIGAPLVSSGDQVAFNAGGRTLITLDGNGTVRSWDTASHQQESSFQAASTDAMALSPDGEILATAGTDSDVHLWDVATGQQIGAALTGPTQGITSLAFSQDGRTLAAADGRDLEADDGHRKVWVWRTDYLVNILPRLCARAGRTLTPTEWRHMVPSGPSYRPVCAGNR